MKWINNFQHVRNTLNTPNAQKSRNNPGIPSILKSPNTPNTPNIRNIRSFREGVCVCVRVGWLGQGMSTSGRLPAHRTMESYAIPP